MDTDAKAREIAPCNCQPSLGSHHAECPAQHRLAIAAALREAYMAGRSDAAKIADEDANTGEADKWADDVDPAAAAARVLAGRRIAAIIRITPAE